jgi:hypothetical protein
MLEAAVRLRGERAGWRISGQAMVVPEPGVDLIDFDLRNRVSSEAAKALWAMVGLALVLPRLIARESGPGASPASR